MKNKRLKYIFALLMVIALFALPHVFTDRYFQHIMVLCCIFTILASSWNLLAGYSGLLNLGHAAFFGIGAYSSALLAINLGLSPWLGLFTGGFVAAIFGGLLGIPSFRLSGPYLAITTIGFSEIMRMVCMNWVSLTRGSLGLSDIPPLTPITLGGGLKIEFVTEQNAYYVLVVFVILILYLVRKLLKSEFGLTLESMREEEGGAESIGINTSQYKLTIFMISAFLAGFAGALYAHYIRLISPEMLGLGETFTILTMVMVGGLGTFTGPIIGAVLLTVLSEALIFFEEAINVDIRLVIYGGLLMATIIFMRKGVVGLFDALVGRKSGEVNKS
jgi:branched-chain amino acid transport system permease protein